MADTPKYLSREQVAELIGVSEDALDRFRKADDFPKPRYVGRFPR